MPSFTRVVHAVLLAATSATVLAAQGGTSPRTVEVDRVVAVVARRPILMSEVLERINLERAGGLQVPRDSAGQLALAREVLNKLVDEELLVTVAQEYEITVAESEVAPNVDRSIQNVRSNFPDEATFREALRREGFGTPEEYRRRSIEQATREAMQAKALDTLRALGRIAPVNVTEREVREAFERLKAQLGPRPQLVGFRQVVVAPRPSAAALEVARQRADSLRLALEAGADFDSVARAFSADQGSAVQGGDLGWRRRGEMVQEFDQMMFALTPGRISPLVQTVYGFHVLRVDRVRAGEVRARHVLIQPQITEADAEVARLKADSARTQWMNGVPFDTVVARFHDRDEEKSLPDGIPVDSLPPEYRLALRNQPEGTFTEVFTLPVPGGGLRKYIVARVMEVKPAGEWTLADYQDRVRRQLAQEKSTRRTLDILRREYYVSLRL